MVKHLMQIAIHCAQKHPPAHMLQYMHTTTLAQSLTTRVCQ